MIGGTICNTKVAADLLPGDIQQLTASELDFLWRIFTEIGRIWHDDKFESVNVKSEWLEFVHAKTKVVPSYTGEYSNAVSCVSELIEMYGEKDAFVKLLLKDPPPDPEKPLPAPPPPLTRLEHAKQFVVDEFIRVQVAMEGFKSWGGKNYKGFIGGSRYNRLPRARVFQDDGK